MARTWMDDMAGICHTVGTTYVDIFKNGYRMGKETSAKMYGPDDAFDPYIRTLGVISVMVLLWRIRKRYGTRAMMMAYTALFFNTMWISKKTWENFLMDHPEYGQPKGG